jgi:cysteine desulfurase
MNYRHIYLDNAASTPMDPAVRERMLEVMDMVGNPSATHHFGRTMRAEVEKARTVVAGLLGASPAEIVFTSGGTEADNMALIGAYEGLGVRHFISSPLEHHAVTHTLEALAERDPSVRVDLLIPNSEGHLDLHALERMLAASSGPVLVSLMHGNNEIGNLNDIEAIGQLCRAHKAYFHCDMVQTVGLMNVDLRILPVDFLAASAHKFYGPKGVGILYRREGCSVPPLIRGGGQERNQRAGTENVAAICGMALALERLAARRGEAQAHLQALKDYFRQQLAAQIPGVAFNGDTRAGHSLPTVLNVAFPGDDVESLMLMNLDIRGISASGGSACTSGAITASHVLTALGHSEARIANSVRFSFSTFTTQEDLDYTLGVLRELVVGVAV